MRCPSPRALFFAAALALAPAAARAADPAPATHVRYDVDSGSFSAPLPHGTPFFLDVAAVGDESGALVSYAPATDGNACPKESKNSPKDVQGPILGLLGPAPTGGTGQVISTQIGRLKSDTRYCFWISLIVQWSDASKTQLNDGLHAELTKLLQRSPASISDEQILRLVARALDGVAAVAQAQADTKQLAQQILDKNPSALAQLSGALSEINRYGEQLVYWQTDLKAAGALPPLGKDALGGNDPSKLVQAVQALAGLHLPARVQQGAVPGDLTTAAATAADAASQATTLARTACSAPSAPAGCPTLNKLWEMLGRLSSHAQSLSDAWSSGNDLLTKFTLATVRVTLSKPVTKPTLPAASSFTERAALYISGNVGMAAVLFPNDGWDMALFVGVNFYFAALDKDISLYDEWSFWRSFSVVAGYTLNDVNSPSGDAHGVLGNKAALLGASMRLTDYLQLGGGAAFVRQSSSNPLISDNQVRATPYFNLSIDIDVVDIVKGIFSKGK